MPARRLRIRDSMTKAYMSDVNDFLRVYHPAAFKLAHSNSDELISLWTSAIEGQKKGTVPANVATAYGTAHPATPRTEIDSLRDTRADVWSNAHLV